MASTLKHTWSTSIKNDSGASVAADAPLEILGDAEVNFAVNVEPTATEEVDATIAVAKVVSAFVTSDQPVTIKTNAVDAEGGQTIELVASRALSWNSVAGDQEDRENPFTPAITKFFITNNGTKTAKVRGGFLLQAP